MNQNNRMARLVAFLIATALPAFAAGEPSTGLTTVDATIVVMVAGVAAITTMYGLGAALRGGSVVWQKVVKFFSKSL